MKLTDIKKITGTIELITGLHIGSGDTEMHIGGTDNPVIKNPINNEPYIPGSSLKGKMRSLLEWELGLVGICEGKPLSFAHLDKVDAADLEDAKTLLKLFGGAPMPKTPTELITEVGPTRLSFWDCGMDPEWLKSRDKNLLTEIKMENTIDRIKGTAENPRNTERVPAGSMFSFALSMRIHDDENLEDMLINGLKLIQLTGLGGSGSRGYGKVAFHLKDPDLQKKLDVSLEEQAA
ncbi:MAG: CRISPR-associated RAMP Csm3 [uncultured Thiotrichaceae bacterium]|uniref:CRISPR system Cms endoribonuclease Csm3 n=1 Tax=uncultured Thiotrichaceae bacterium TaxID=298394 RepID=A0A6S6TM78_9GAMM|nr:MAG: CRISPR-associated RAMP Csm3 [uncultured Thiotrichaceae bacterium]